MKNLKTTIFKASIIALGLSPLISNAQGLTNYYSCAVNGINGGDLQLGTTGNDAWQIANRCNNSNALEFRRNNNGTWSSALLSLSTAGKLGIGTNTPNEILSLKSGQTTRIRIGSDGDAFTNPAEMGGIIFTKHWDTNPCAKIYTYTNGQAISGYFGADIRFATSPNGSSPNPTDRMVIDQNGNIGIGTNSPSEKVSVISNGYTSQISISSNLDAANYTGEMGGILFKKHWGTNPCAKIYTYSNGGASSYIGADLRFATTPMSGFSPADRMVINQDGNVGIGTLTPVAKLQVSGKVLIGTHANGVTDYTLAVEGKIYCQELNVTPSPWSDYVFKSDYKLASLTEVEKYIKENGHLEHVPSAEQVAKIGYKVGEMDATLLRKVEELTLYVLELKKENESQQKEISELKAKK